MLIISPICGKFKKDKDTFGKMDPYVKIKIGDEKFKAKAAKGMGKNPIWSEKFGYKYKN